MADVFRKKYRVSARFLFHPFAIKRKGASVMKILFVRHGKDDDTVRGGWSQTPLTEEGIRQAESLVSFVQKNNLNIKHIYSSDLPRAMQTAEAVGNQLQLPVIPMQEFREVNNGILAGMKNDLAAETFPGLYWNTLDWEQRYPGGESPQEFYERVCEAWNRFQKEILERNENVLLVTHGGVIQVILSIVNGVEYSNRKALRKVGNTEPIALEYTSGKWQAQSILAT
jgi:probable phosphoglycerate mutase